MTIKFETNSKISKILESTERDIDCIIRELKIVQERIELMKDFLSVEIQRDNVHRNITIKDGKVVELK